MTFRLGTVGGALRPGAVSNVSLSSFRLCLHFIKSP